MFKLTVSRSQNFIESNQAGLAGKSTINRLEYCPETILDQEKSRYHKIEPLPQELEKAFVDIFFQSYQKPPKSIIKRHGRDG